MDEPLPLKPMFFVVEAARDDLMAVPLPVRQEFGHALYVVQTGGTPAHSKPLHGFGSGVLEIVENQDGDTYRAIYTVRFDEAIYVLHVLKKKSHSGIKTPQRELDTLKSRLQRALQLHEEHLRAQAEKEQKP